jgi:large subunit ribosomal protein L5
MSYVPRLKTKYAEEVAAKLQEQFNYSSAMQVPRLQKICINQGVGKATSDKKIDR